MKEFFREIDHREYTDSFSPHPLTPQVACEICEYSGKDQFYGLFLGEKIVGYGLIRGWDEGYDIPSLGLCILKQYQGHGLGGLLLRFLETSCRLQGVNNVMLKVKKKNVKAMKLYEASGFVFKVNKGDFFVGYKDINANSDAERNQLST